MYESNQEVFNTVAEHLLKQGCKAWGKDSDGDDAGRLRLADGTTCAIGCLIPPERYYPELEDHYPDGFEVRSAAGIDMTVGSAFLSRLVELHDDSEVQDWRSELKQIAFAFGLQLPPSLAATAPSEQPVTTISA